MRGAAEQGGTWKQSTNGTNLVPDWSAARFTARELGGAGGVGDLDTEACGDRIHRRGRRAVADETSSEEAAVS
jgi:hypothetical protein